MSEVAHLDEAVRPNLEASETYAAFRRATAPYDKFA
jgi:hypothetical protein